VSLLGGEPLILWSWVVDHLAEIWHQLVQHVVLTVIAVTLGLAISLPIAVWGYRRRTVLASATIVADLLYTIPSLALFGFLVPITGITYLTVEVALVSYTLLILIRNVAAGLAGVPEDAKDAARGMGLSTRQILWSVEIPLAMPAIVAGVRVATVSTIGLVTVGGWIGFGGLGNFIFEGLSVFFSTEIIVGAVLTVVLALVADALIRLAERRLTPWSRARRAPVIDPRMDLTQLGASIN
jgi:osmoprotectant transport system permease protein